MPTSLRNAFLTPETLEGQPACKQLALPVDLLRYAYGSLAALTDEENWEKHGEIEPAAAADYFEDWLYALVEDSCLSRAEVLRVRMNANTSIAHNTEVFNYWTNADSSAGYVFGNSDLLTGTFNVLVPAVITVTYQLLWSNNTTGLRDARLRHNGTWIALSRAKADGQFAQSIEGSLSLLAAAGDTIRVGAYQDSGSALNLVVSGNIQPRMSIVAHPRE